MAEWFLNLAGNEHSGPSKKTTVKTAAEDVNPAAAGVQSKKSSLNKTHIFELLQSPDTFATTLLTVCLIMYGDETFKVEPLALYKWLEDDFGTKLSEENESRLAAILVALTTDFFFSDLQTFKNVCKTLSSGDPGAYDPQMFEDPPTLAEILWGMYEVALVSDDDAIDSTDYHGAVKGFIDSTVKDNALEELDPADGTDPTDGSTDPTQIIADNVKELKAQLVYTGLADIPVFPKFAFDI